MVQNSVSFNLDATAGARFVERQTLTGTANIKATGNAGNNVLNGGLGSDTFVFRTALGASNIDRISDFGAVDDTIRLDDAVFAGLAIGTLVASALAMKLNGLRPTPWTGLYTRPTLGECISMLT